ncbi:MAG: protease SohB [Pseudomonadota bacterium]
MEWFAEYGLFLAKGVTGVILLALLLRLISRSRQDGEGLQAGYLDVEALNDRYQAEADGLRTLVWDDAAWKAERKQRKLKAKADKSAAKAALKASKADAEKTAGDKDSAPDNSTLRARVYVLQFSGDMAASAVTHLRQEISALLAVADAGRDEVVLLLESPGGVVHGYGLAASQLARIRDAGLSLTICVDKVAASGGYMMACLANRLLAAPFAIIGSIGVVAQIPNFHRLLKKNDIDVELMTAGQYKRTLTLLGENTEAGRQKFQQDIDETHLLFKGFVQQWRPQVDIDAVATGEHWFASQALPLHLVDGLQTSDDYLRQRARDADLFALHWRQRKTLGQKLGLVAEESAERVLTRWWQRATQERWY